MEVDLRNSLKKYEDQLLQVSEALSSTEAGPEYDSLAALQADLLELIGLTKESLDTVCKNNIAENGDLKESATDHQNMDQSGSAESDPLADEYALFMSEMAKSGAYEEDKKADEHPNESEVDGTQQATDIEDDLNSLQGMKCAAYHTHKWGGAPSLHNAMVCGVVRETSDGATNFQDIQVRVMYTHPTHREMLPCPYYLDGDCKFDDEQCKYSHGEVVSLSSLQEAIEPHFEGIKQGSLVLAKLNSAEDTNLKQPSSEKYLLWHRAVVKEVDFKEKTCVVKFEHSHNLKDSKNQGIDDLVVDFANLFPLKESSNDDTDSSSSLSDVEVQNSTRRVRSGGDAEYDYKAVLSRSLINKPGAIQLGEWEKHTRGIGSKLMLAMGYVAGSGLGSEGTGRVEPVPARVLPTGKSLDHIMTMKNKVGNGDPLKAEKRLKRLQRRQEERNKQVYEREKDREYHNVFNFLNRTLGSEANASAESKSVVTNPDSEIKQTSNKNLNIEQFRISEDAKRVERDVIRLKNSLSRHATGSTIHKNIKVQIESRNRELDELKSRERNISNEQNYRKDRKRMSEF